MDNEHQWGDGFCTFVYNRAYRKLFIYKSLSAQEHPRFVGLIKLAIVLTLC